jgi:HlyD family secretion protein
LLLVKTDRTCYQADLLDYASRLRILSADTSMKKLLIIIAIVVFVLAVAGGGVYLGMKLSGRSDDADATPVRFEPVVRGDLTELVQAPGEIQPRTKVSISARVSARITELPFKEGDTVKKGDVVVKLDSTDLQAGLRSTEARYAAEKAQITVSQARMRAQQAQVAASEAQLREAQRDLKRQNELLATHDVAQSIVDTAQRHLDETQAMLDSAKQSLEAEQANLEVMKFNLDAAEAEIMRARDNLSYTTITSPIDGMITKLNAKEGELVVTGTMNNAGTVLLEIGDFSEMLLAARVDEANIATVKVGQKARIHTQAYGDRVFDGIVETVALAQSGGAAAQLSGSSSGRYFKVEVRVDSGGERLFAGLTSDVDIESQHHTNILKVPSQAVLGRTTDELPAQVRDGNPNVNKSSSQSTVVFRMKDGKALVVPVVVGASDLTHTVIKSGLADGDMVITGPYKALEKLAHDQKVKDEKAATRPSTQPTSAPATQSAQTQPSSRV